MVGIMLIYWVEGIDELYAKMGLQGTIYSCFAANKINFIHLALIGIIEQLDVC